MKRIPLFNLRSQYQKIKKEVDKSIRKIVEKGDFILGDELRLFEKEFAEYNRIKYCFGVSSGSTALDLALKAIGIKSGDEVICPTLTFTASAEAIVHLGATPVFVDINEKTLNIDKDQIIKNISKKTKAIIIVHLHGQMTDMAAIYKIAKKYNLKIIEDAAQAHGATYKGKYAGFWGDAACFSFYPSKNLGCFGDGGAVITNNSKIAKMVGLLRDHGRVSKYSHSIVGFDGRLDNLQAAILRVKLRYLNKWNAKRNQIAKYYSRKLSKEYILPFNSPDSNHVYYVFTLQHKKRNKIMDLLAQKGIGSGIYYPYPLHLQKAYSNLKYQKGDFKVAENACKNIFSIPIYPELNKNEMEYIATTLNQIINKQL